MPCKKRVYRNAKASGSKKQRALLVPQVLQMNCGLTTCFVPQSVYMGCPSLVGSSGKHSGDNFLKLWRIRGSLVAWANNSVGTKSCPTPPANPPCAPTQPANGTFRFWVRQVHCNVKIGTKVFQKSSRSFRNHFKCISKSFEYFLFIVSRL